MCKLSGLKEDKPFPSLSFCFRNNVSSCCLTAHDQMIGESYNGFMPTACQTQFVFFEQLQCIGCHPQQPNVMEESTPKNKGKELKVRLCRKFVENLYIEATTDKNKDSIKERTLGLKSSKFDKCGFIKTNPEEYLTDKNGKVKRDEFNKKIVTKDEETVVIIPSTMFKDATLFVNDGDIKPMFFKDYLFEIESPAEALKTDTEKKAMPL